MELRRFIGPPLDTNAYLLTFPDTEDALIVDAPHKVWGTFGPELEKLGKKPVAVLLTHGHFDHMLGLSELNEQRIPVYGHRDDERMITHPQERAAMVGIRAEIPAARIDNFVEHHHTLTLAGETIEIRHVPGHSPGSVLFYFPERDLAFVGDAIFQGSVGRTDLPGGNFDTLAKSIREQIYSLPESCLLYPGHGDETTVGHEMRTNPFVPAQA